jgi:glycosyltransferase involved in cell wall biosynthesis
MNKEISIGVVIPSYNEGNDLIDTLQTIFNQTSQFLEVIIVDDSSDGTELLVSSIFGSKVNLIHRDSPLGRCSARNLGIQVSTTEVIVILNADVRLPPDFCEKLQKKYSLEDCDALGVEVVITNTHYPYPRYLYAQHLSLKRQNIGWTEGFSIKRSAFMKTKGFPDGYPLPILAGEDGELVFDLQRTGAKICFDFDLKVTTIMPEDWKIIENQIRGRASLRTLYFVYDKSLLSLFARSILKQIIRLIILISLIPFCWQVFWIWNHFHQDERDLLHYARFILYEKWLRSHQEWSDLNTFLRLQLKNRNEIIDVVIKRPSQLSITNIIGE